MAMTTTATPPLLGPQRSARSESPPPSPGPPSHAPSGWFTFEDLRPDDPSYADRLSDVEEVPVYLY